MHYHLAVNTSAVRFKIISRPLKLIMNSFRQEWDGKNLRMRMYKRRDCLHAVILDDMVILDIVVTFEIVDTVNINLQGQINELNILECGRFAVAPGDDHFVIPDARAADIKILTTLTQDMPDGLVFVGNNANKPCPIFGIAGDLHFVSLLFI